MVTQSDTASNVLAVPKLLITNTLVLSYFYILQTSVGNYTIKSINPFEIRSNF